MNPQAAGTLSGGGINLQVAGSAPQAPKVISPALDPTYLSGNIGQQVLGATNTNTNYSAPAPAGPTAAQIAAASAAAQFDPSINQTQTEIGNLDNQFNVGKSNLDTAYNSAWNQLQQAKATNQGAYDTNKTQTAQDYSTGKNNVGVNAGNSLNSLLRLLGAHGAGGSSAAQIVAPTAVGQAASSQRGALGQTFGRNQQALDTGWNNYLTGEKGAETDLGNQRTNNQNSLQASIDSNRASLLNSLATLQGQKAQAAGGDPNVVAQPYIDQANQLVSAATLLGQQVPVLQTAPVNYTPPSLDSYTTAPNPTATSANPTAGATDSILPYLSLLTGQDKKQNNLSAVA